jgi:hypothetical protein
MTSIKVSYPNDLEQEEKNGLEQKIKKSRGKE